MKARKFFGALIMMLVVLFGAFSPAIDLLSSGHPKVAYAAGDDECGYTDVACGIVKVYVYITGAIPLSLATISGIILDYSIWTTVSSDSYTSNDAADSFVVRGWKLVRDFSNLVFIFGLFLTAFVLILGKSEGGESIYNPKRMIARILLMALFINFSFFLCRTIIDVSNLLARAFYTQITTDNTAATTNANQTTQAGNGNIPPASIGNASSVYENKNLAGIRSVSLGILQLVNPQELLLKADGPTSFTWGNFSKILITYTMVMVFNVFLAFIFFSSAIFLFVRTIGLWFLMILSPIAFASRVIPSLQKKEYFGWDDWFSQFVGLASSVVIFLFFMYLAVLFLRVGVNETNPNGDGGIIGVVFSIGIKLIMVGIVLIFGKKVSKDLSGKIGVMASDGVSKVITGGAMVAGAVATGGVSGALQMGRRYATEQAKAAALNLGTNALGEERMQLIQKRGWMNSPLRNFNPLTARGRNVIGRVMRAGPAPEPGSFGAFTQTTRNAFRQGAYGNRQYDMQQAAIADAKAKAKKALEDKEKTKSIDKKLEDLKKEFDNGEITNKEYNDRRKELALQKKEILNPTAGESKAVKDAEEAKKKAIDQEKTGARVLDDKLAKTVSDIAKHDKTIADTAGKLSAATTALTNATSGRNKADADLANKLNEIQIAQNTFNAQKYQLEQDKAQHQATISSADQELLKIDQELATIPKTGFGVDRAKINDLETRRQAALAQKRTAQASFGQTINQSNLLQTAHEGSLNTLNREKAAIESLKKAAMDAEREAQNTINKVTADDQTAKTEKVRLEAEQQRLTADKQALADAVTNAEQAVSAAKQGLDSKKEEIKLREELDKRQRVPKTDTDNRERNNARIEELKQRLSAIANGGVPPSNP